MWDCISPSLFEFSFPWADVMPAREGSFLSVLSSEIHAAILSPPHSSLRLFPSVFLVRPPSKALRITPSSWPPIHGIAPR